MRVAGAVLLFWLVRVFVKEKIKKKDIPRFILCGLTGVAVNQLLFFQGLNLTSPLNAAIIMTSNPIMVMIFAAVILKNAITFRKGAGVLLGAIGAGSLIYLSSNGVDTSSSSIGDFFVLINAASYAIYLVLVKPLMGSYKPITVISYVFLFGLIIVTPFGINEAFQVAFSSFTPFQWLSLAFVIIGTTFLAYLLNIFALKSVQPTVASAYIYLQPIFAALSTWFFSFFLDLEFSNDITPAKVLCAAFIFVGVFMVSFQKQTKISS